jgi:hypothetical protein
VLKWARHAVENHGVQLLVAPWKPRIVRAIALFALLAVVAAGVAGGTPAAHAGVDSYGLGLGERFGFSPGGDILWNRSYAQQAAELDAMAATGAKWVRIDFPWDTVQAGGPGSWSWRQDDTLVQLASERGLHVLAVLAYTPTWARRSVCNTNHACPPSDPNAFAAFARAAAQRYGSRVSAWEVWNEPNWDPFWASGPNAADYVNLLKPTYVAIKSVAPRTTVITGGLAPYGDLARTPVDAKVAREHPVNFLKAMYAAGARGYFDGVGHHPYAYPYAPADCCIGWNAVLYTQTLHDVMAANGDGAKKVWGTESGAPTAGWGAVSEAQQAEWVRQYFALWDNWSFTGPLLFYTLRDFGTDPSNNDDHFGFMRTDLSPKPAYNVFVQQVQAAAGVGTVAGGSATSPFLKVSSPSQAVAANPKGGYYVLGANGNVVAFGGAPYSGSPVFPTGLARDIAVMPDGNGYVVLDGWGGVHEFGSARGVPVPGTYWPGWDIARRIAITSDGRGIAVLDGWGGIHSSGDAPHFSPAFWPGWDIARAFAITPDNRGVYLLDGWGGVHVAGTARYRPGGPFWPGWNIARDIVVTPDNGGYAILDGFGGIHLVGDAPRGATPGYTHADTWRGLSLKTG